MATRRPTRHSFPFVTIALLTGSTTLPDLSYTISETVFVSCNCSPIATIKFWTNNSHSTRLSLLHSTYTMLSPDPLNIAHEIM
uniref:Putative secreted protein n=1 Tax=Ixodes ricinus TaxID=34613 RepID=A0A6B0U7B6_IXORI